ncbi:AAA family ATPase [Litorivivens sp.]|uniref:AAA family ATPase n=1 Tax=Litorivivens sp. TaxID=2020868 RepID=UPI003564E5A1
MKQLWAIVGGNGAGKSTFYQQMLEPMDLPFINADVIAREVWPDDPEGNSYDAAQLASRLRDELLDEGRSFCFETVFSHPSKIDILGKAKALGYQIILVVINVSSSDLNKARVAQRVEHGGHSVPDEKVEARIPRMLQNVANAIPLCDEVRVLDNSSYEKPFLPVLTIKNGNYTYHIESLPDWAESIFQ